MLVAVTAVLGATAGNRSQKQMKAIAAQKLAGVATRSEAGLQLSTVYENDQLAMIGDTAVGFAIVSRDVAQQEVLGYSMEPFSGEMPAALSWWMERMTRRLASGTPIATRGRRVAVPNFIKTQWDQDTPYNGMCPLTTQGRCLTGCVATAMAQIMKYFEYPEKGKGKGYYILNNKTFPTSINSTYNWSRMLNRYSSASNTSNKLAVQQLMYDAGCSVGMEYDTSASSASDLDAARAFFVNFGYDSLSVTHRWRRFYADDEWMELIYPELAEARPVLYSGMENNSNSGHAFLLSGNDEDGLVYVNWGWGGPTGGKTYNGFYEIANLSINGKNYDSNHSMVIGLKAQSKPDVEEEPFSSWGCEPYTLKAIGKDKLEFTTSSIYNISVLYFRGDINCYFRNTVTGQEESIKLYDLRNPIAPLYGGIDMADEITTTSLEPGTYDFYVASKASIGSGQQTRNESVAKELRTTGGPCPHYTVTKASDGTLTVVSAEPTAIGTPIQQRQDDGATYDLSGRRSSTVAPGIYIRNGRKFLQK